MSEAEHLGLDTAQRAGLLAGDDVPAKAGAYCWWDGAQPLYVGATNDLQHQLLRRELYRDEGPAPRVRKIARERLRDRDQLPPPAPERRERVDAFLAECAVAWIETDTVDDAERVATEARPKLFRKWRPRSYDGRLLHAYLRSVETHGRVHTQVPLRTHAQGRLQRIDAVHFPKLPAGAAPFEESAFRRALASGVIELVEIEAMLDRAVFGQLLVGRDMFVDVWHQHLPTDAELRLTALVARGDPGLEPLCERNDIRVVAVESLDDEPDEADRDNDW